ncbi:hypothetical protein BTE77_35390 [Ensifer adhaerens]|nr:hypothetical protein BTE77_35390 [Ensifer adhaerens]
MKLKFTVAAISLLALGACSSEETCTPELLRTKTEDLSKAIEAFVTKEPTKAAEATAKLQKIVTDNSMGANARCKAVDEFRASIKG